MTPEERIADLEEQLARVSRRMRYMIEGAPDGLLVVFKETKDVLQSNPAFARLVGEEPLLMVPGQKESDVAVPLGRYVDERYWPTIASVLEAQHRGEEGEPVHRADLIHQQTGERIPCELTFHRPERKSRATAVFVRDLRERLRSERKIEDYSRTLEARNRELRETQSQLVQQGKMAALGALVAGVAHDINTPLGSIKSSADLAASVCGKLEGAGVQLPKLLSMLTEANANIATASERIDDIIRSLRSFARLDEAETKRVNLHEGIETALRLVEAQAKERVTIERDFGDIPELTCRAGEINQVLMNVISNAVQAIDGTGTVTVRTRVSDDEVHVAVSDTGKGISAEDRARVFDPGFTTKGVGVGTGLGLSIAYRIVRDHAGRIEVESERGVGSTFTICLPVERSAPSARERTPKKPPPDLRLVDAHSGVNASIRAAVETKLLARLASGPGYADELAEELELDPRATRLVLDVLQAAGYCNWEDGRFAPNATTKLMQDTRGDWPPFDMWQFVPRFLKEGTCIQLPRGSGAEEREASYARAVAMLNRLFEFPSRQLAERLEPPQAGRVLDVGCGSGVWSLAILEAHASLHGTGLDFPRVLDTYKAEAKARGVAERVTTIEGNMHEVTLDEGAYDLITIANVVHLEPEERLEPLFSRLRPALKEGGELVIIDAIHESPACAISRAVYALHLSMRVAEGVVHAPAALQRALQQSGYGRVSVIELAPEAGALGALRASR